MTEAKTNITLSGWAGVGTSTLTLLLALTLERKFYPVTQVFRDLDNYFNTDDKKVLSREFEETYQPTVGKLVDMAVKLGRKTNPKLEIGICGEHGGEPSSVEFCVKIGMNYVSCSPYRVPIARLAAAQARIAMAGGEGAEANRTK